MKNLIGIIHRDLLLAYRQRQDLLNSLLFFAIVCFLVPLGLGPDLQLLRKIGPGIIWVAALLSVILSLPRLFAQDFEDGSLEQLLLSREPLLVLVLGKILGHWLATGLPLLLVAPVLALQFDLDWPALLQLEIALALGTPALSLIGALGAALTVGLRNANVLISLLILPLYIPVLIFGSASVNAVLTGLDPSAHVYLLAAITSLAVVISPILVCMGLRIAYE